jgi:hypothetical protein
MHARRACDENEICLLKSQALISPSLLLIIAFVRVGSVADGHGVCMPVQPDVIEALGLMHSGLSLVRIHVDFNTH